VCSCGWRSPMTISTGIAGTLWDTHAVEHETSVDPD
jgi:hypothetical protein